MSLKARIQNDINAHMKAKNTFARDTLRLVLGEIQGAEKSGKTPKEFNDVEVESFLRKQVKTRRDSAATYAEVNQVDRAEKETAEAELLATYLPPDLPEAEVVEIIDNAFATFAEVNGTPTRRDRNAIMTEVNAEVRGRFDGKVISELVKDRLS